MKSLIIYALIFPTLLWGAKLTDAEIEYFLDVTLNSETNSHRQRTIQKWNQDIKIKVHQDVAVNADDLAKLHSVINTLNPLLHGRKIHIVTQEENINFHFTNRTGLKEFGIRYIGGFAQVWSDTSGSESATIGVDINFGAENDGTRRPDYTAHITTEELTQALGLFGDSRSFNDSIFYEDFTVLTSLSTLDKKLINILYHPEVKVGMNEADLYALLPTLDYNETAVFEQVVVPTADDDGDGLTNEVQIDAPTQKNITAGWLWHSWPWVYSAKKSGWLYLYPHGDTLYVYDVTSDQWGTYAEILGN